MEAALRKSDIGCEVKEEDEKVLNEVGNGRKNEEDDNLRPLSPNKTDLSCHKQCSKHMPVLNKIEKSSTEPNSRTSSSIHKEQGDQLELAKAKMGEVREENQRLRMSLDQMMKDYEILQNQFHETVLQKAKKSTNNTAVIHQQMDESELVSLSLGRTSSNQKKKDKYKNPSQGEADEQDNEGLVLGLDCNPTPETSFEEVKEEDRSPSKIVKTMRSRADDEVLQQNPVKKARVSVRVRCDTPTMNDGCQWRKYGQKIAKGNPCPRAYYRCTVAPSCPVRKQVQRCAGDMSILITTYEGTHNHPLPISATAMASTTSAAASMLTSGSSTSGELHGLNFSLSADNSKANPFYLANSSISSSCPTITLDLTSTTASSSSYFNRSIPTNFPPIYSSTNLNAASITWRNGDLNYGTQPYTNNQIGSLSFGRHPQENLYQSCMQIKNMVAPTQQSIPVDTIEAATKAIASDPSFQSALATALTSIIGSSSSGGGGGGSGDTLGNPGGGDKFGQNLRLGEPFPVLSSNYPSTSNANKCTSNYLNKSPPIINSQSKSLMFLPLSTPFSASKSESTSPDDSKDQS